ncbi:hypothetical protein F8M41_024904 [Gigaspora margarita]|uniref:Uncharacterized protein n=1 Tax=Gigaspora margarita TaxID=4874 RepID=A0A8H3XJA8_GIGMA|nr:hypothetical protein F8M41_024904 [Gigaspora margarita]
MSLRVGNLILYDPESQNYLAVRLNKWMKVCINSDYLLFSLAENRIHCFIFTGVLEVMMILQLATLFKTQVPQLSTALSPLRVSLLSCSIFWFWLLFASPLSPLRLMLSTSDASAEKSLRMLVTSCV